VGYRTGYFGKYLNAYDKLLDATPGHVPPHWDEWRAFSHAEFFDFDTVERGLGEAKAVRRCWLSGESEGEGGGKGKRGKKGRREGGGDEKKGEKGDKKEKRREKKCKREADEVIADGAENYSTDVLRDQVIGFIRKVHQEGKPWFVHLAPKSPHGPFLSPARYQPDPDVAEFTQEAKDRLATCPLFDWKDRPPSYLEADMSDKPQWIQESKSGRTKEERLEKVRKMQLVSVLAAEDAVESIMKVLGELGVADDTIVVYTADNGFAWGEHWHTHKNCAYEECIRVPMVVLDPRAPAGPRTVDQFTMNVDLAPTIAQWAGATAPFKVDGVSFVGLVDGSATQPWARTQVLTECWGPGTEGRPDTHAAVRTAKWKYVEHYTDPARTTVRTHKKGGAEVELYDLVKDPHEVDNLLRLPPDGLARTGHTAEQVEATRTELRTALDALKKE
jgi:arylsulfatase A-like enzyme